jgi:predicted ATPase
LSHARRSKDFFNLGLALTVVGWFHQIRREPQLAYTQAEVAITLADEHGFPEWMSWGRFHRGWATAELGQLEDGIAEMEAAMAGFRRLGGVPRLRSMNALLAQSYGRIGRCDEALAMLDYDLAAIERTGERLDEAEMRRIRGELLMVGGESAAPEAESSFRQAIALARVREARWWELRSTVSLARLLRDTDRRNEARTLLAEIYNWFTEGFELPDLKEAKALLEELGGGLQLTH